MKCYKLTGCMKESAMVFGCASIIYEIGEYVKAPGFLSKRGYHPLAFTNKKAAKAFQKTAMMDKSKLWQADGEDRVKPLPKMLQWGLLGAGYFDDAWVDWPKGTAMFEKIKLLKEVEYGPLFP